MSVGPEIPYKEAMTLQRSTITLTSGVPVRNNFEWV